MYHDIVYDTLVQCPMWCPQILSAWAERYIDGFTVILLAASTSAVQSS